MTPGEIESAVALEYRPNPVPLVVATGREILAQEIVAEANRQGVPVMRDPLLAARLADLPAGTAIPEELYRAVAVVLSWVYWMEGREPSTSSAASREAGPAK